VETRQAMEILPVHVSPRRSCHNKNLLSKEDGPTREYCRTQLSVERITLECPALNGLRSILGNPTSTEQTSGETNTHDIFKYFKRVGAEKPIWFLQNRTVCVICLKRMRANSVFAAESFLSTKRRKNSHYFYRNATGQTRGAIPTISSPRP